MTEVFDVDYQTARLTHLVRCAGCASKIGPAQLAGVLKTLNLPEDVNLLVGLSTGDDAGVYRLSQNLAIVQTLDFFTPIVDDPYLFGQIAATNSLSDIYAMGGKPLTAMNIVCYPIRERGPADLLEILRGGADKVVEAGASLVGGHSIQDLEPKYGLSVTGTIDPDQVATNAGAQVGDVIVLTKPIGTGIIATAMKFDDCPEESFRAATTSMTHLNAGAAAAIVELGIGPNRPVHAATDITGFSLLGHLYKMAAASGQSITIDTKSVPLMPHVVELARRGNTTAGGVANLQFIGENLVGRDEISEHLLSALADPQTSGGLAISISASQVSKLQQLLRTNGTLVQAIIGNVVASKHPCVQLTL